MARTEHISRACEQLHPTICLLEKVHGLLKCNARSVTYCKKYLWEICCLHLQGGTVISVRSIV